MITDPACSVAVSCLGWVDHGALWTLSSDTVTPEVIRLGDAQWLSLHPGSPDQTVFAVMHHFDGSLLRITGHSYAEPATVLASVDVRGWTASMTGAAEVWAGHEWLFVGYLGDSATGAAGYYLIRVTESRARVDRLDWFDDRFDHGYQGVGSVVAFGDHGYLFGVQRSSELALASFDDVSRVRFVGLADRGGNPAPISDSDGRGLWVIDYDTIVRLDAKLQARETLLAQPAVDGLRMFLGDGWLNPTNRHLLVARPGTGDVVEVAPSPLRIVASHRLGRQPLQAVRTSDGRIVARDWHSGDLLTAAPA